MMANILIESYEKTKTDFLLIDRHTLYHHNLHTMWEWGVRCPCPQMTVLSLSYWALPAGQAHSWWFCWWFVRCPELCVLSYVIMFVSWPMKAFIYIYLVKQGEIKSRIKESLNNYILNSNKILNIKYLPGETNKIVWLLVWLCQLYVTLWREKKWKFV